MLKCDIIRLYYRTMGGFFMQEILKELDEIYAGRENVMLQREEVEKIISDLSLGKLSNIKTVLLVDDAAFIRKVEKEILTENGYMIVAEAENGEESIEKYMKHKPDMVIMNIIMPIMDGIEATKRIKEFDENAKIVMFSGLSNYQTIKDSVLAGASGFIGEVIRADRIMSIFEKSEVEKKTATKNQTKKSMDVPVFKEDMAKRVEAMNAEDKKKVNATKNDTKAVAVETVEAKPSVAAKTNTKSAATANKNVVKPETPVQVETKTSAGYWKADMKPLKVKSPKLLVQEQANALQEITGGKVIALLTGTKKEVAGGADFKYELNITSPKVSSYIYPVFMVAYHINIYPCKFYINEEIAECLNIDSEIIAQNEKDVSNILKKVLQSSKVASIISALLCIVEE